MSYPLRCLYIHLRYSPSFCTTTKQQRNYELHSREKTIKIKSNMHAAINNCGKWGFVMCLTGVGCRSSARVASALCKCAGEKRTANKYLLNTRIYCCQGYPPHQHSVFAQFAVGVAERLRPQPQPTRWYKSIHAWINTNKFCVPLWRPECVAFDMQQQQKQH